MRTTDGQRTVRVHRHDFRRSHAIYINKKKPSSAQPRSVRRPQAARGDSLPQPGLFPIESHRKQQRKTTESLACRLLLFLLPIRVLALGLLPCPLRLHPSFRIGCAGEVRDRSGAQLIREQVSDLETVLPPSYHFPLLRPQDLLLRLPMRAVLGQVFPRLCLEMHHPHSVAVRSFVHWRYCLVRQYPLQPTSFLRSPD